MRDEQVKFLYKIRCCLKEVVSLIECVPQEVVGFNRITLQEAHLLEIAYATVSHFCTLA